MRQEHYVNALTQISLRIRINKLEPLFRSSVNVPAWISENLDLSPYGNVGPKNFCLRKAGYKPQFHQLSNEEWAEIPANYCEKLEERNQKHLELTPVVETVIYK